MGAMSSTGRNSTRPLSYSPFLVRKRILDPHFLSGVVKNSLPHCGIKTVEIWAGEIIFLHLDGKNRNFPGEMRKMDEIGGNFSCKRGKMPI